MSPEQLKLLESQIRDSYQVDYFMPLEISSGYVRVVVVSDDFVGIPKDKITYSLDRILKYLWFQSVIDWVPLEREEYYRTIQKAAFNGF